MTSFSTLPEDSPIYSIYQKLLDAPMGTALPPLADKKGLDRYSLAINLVSLLNKINCTDNGPMIGNKSIIVSTSHIETLKDLSTELKQEIKLLNKDPEEIELLIAVLLENSKLEPKLIEEKVSTSPVKIEEVSVGSNLGSAKDSNSIRSLVDMTYKGLNQLEAMLSVKTQGELSKGQHGTVENAAVEVQEFKVNWNPNQYVDKVKLGKFRTNQGLGIANNGWFEGLALSKSYGEHNIDVGWFDGLYASITTPYILETPFTFFTRKTNDAKSNETLHQAGFFVNKQMNDRLNLSSEFAENYTDAATGKDTGAFGLMLKYNLTQKLAIASGLTHTGNDFRVSKTADFSSGFYNSMSPGIQKEVFNSLSNYFGKNVNSLPGFSDMKMRFDLQTSKSGSLELHLDWLYDHTDTNANSSNEFQLSTINYSHRLDEKSRLDFTVQALQWANRGMAMSGFMNGFEKKNFSLFQSSYSFLF
jgi:hypothetical protein